mgnify:CR=1 FL=1
MKRRATFAMLVDLLGTIIFSVITVVVSAQIVNRYVFGSSFVFAEEMAVQLMIWIAFLGAAKCVTENAHTRLTVVVDKLSPKLKCGAMLLSNLLCIVFLGIAAWYGFKLVGTTWRGTTIGTHIPEGLVYLAMPLSGLIMIYFLIQSSVGAIRSYKDLGGEAE